MHQPEGIARCRYYEDVATFLTRARLVRAFSWLYDPSQEQLILNGVVQIGRPGTAEGDYGG